MKNNFGGYNFSKNGKLEKLKNKIKKQPKIDLIVAKETDFDNPFLLCGEAKFFHTSMENASHKERECLS